MMTNSMLLNINRNIHSIDTLYTQIATTKKIKVPSDDPITATRALKFRSNVSETEQYQRNISSGMAWMDVTEGAYNNVIDIMKTIKDRSVQAANGTLEATDRQIVAAQIREMVKQLGTEMNITYGGRYVFSGFRTNEPPIFARNEPAKSFQIKQNFSFHDVEKTESYQKLSVNAPLGTDPALGFSTNILKLPYTNVTSLSMDVLDNNVPPNIIFSFCIVPKSITDDDAYDSTNIGVGTVNYIVETGELIVSNDDLANFPENVVVSYQKDGFVEGELNPIVYFDCVDLTDPNLTHYNMSLQNIAYEVSVNTDVNINSLAKNVYTDKMYAELVRLCNFLDDEISVSDSQLLENKYNFLSGEQLTDAIETQLASEKSRLATVLHSRFNNMIGMCDSYIASMSKEQTNLGSRINRLELIQSRLEQDEGGYKKLMSDNEDVDMMEAMMRKSTAEAIYQASLKAGASIIQMTLSNFI